MSRGHKAALGAMVAAFALLLAVEGAALPTAWLPIEEAAVLSRARGGESTEAASGVLYPAVLAPAARLLSPSAAHGFARALSAVLWALVAIPAYLLARRLVPPGPSLVVAGLAVAVPASVYATAAVPDALALLLAVSSLPLLAHASDRGSTKHLVGACSLATAAALARPWFVVLPPALLVAYGLPRSRWRSSLRWPRSLWLAGAAGVAYLVLAWIAPDTATALASPGDTARAAAASLAVAAVGLGVLPWLLAASGLRRGVTRPEAALLASCLPPLALAAGVLGAAAPGRGLDERPLLVLVPLVLALAAAAWPDGVRAAPLAAGGALVVLAALALPALGSGPVARAAGLSIVSADGGSRALLLGGVAVAVAVALLLALVLRSRPVLLPAALAILLLVGQAAAWSSVRDEARALAAAEPDPRDWVDAAAGDGEDVVVAGPEEALDEQAVAQLTLWNRAVDGAQELELSSADPASGQWGVAPAADLVVVRGTELAGTEIARSGSDVLLRPEVPYRLAETIEGVFSDGWSGEQAIYRRFSAAPGTLLVSVDRTGGSETADISIASGPLDADDDRPRARFAMPPGEKREVEVDVPEDRYRVVVTIRPTFAAADGRQLGARIRFSYRPSRG